MAADAMSLNNLPSATGTLMLPQGVTKKGNTPSTALGMTNYIQDSNMLDVSHDSEAPSPNC